MKPNTYTQLYIHLVFAVKNRSSLIQPHFREEVERYITGMVQNKNHKMLAIYLMPDHAHILLGFNPKYAISDTVHLIKTESTDFIKEKGFTPFKFNWQDGYGAFSHSRTELNKVINYILNQEEHHRKRSFKTEYLAFLKKYDIEFKEEYLFEFYSAPFAIP